MLLVLQQQMSKLKMILLTLKVKLESLLQFLHPLLVVSSGTSIGAILGANVTINDRYSNSQRNGNGTEYTNTGDSILFVSATIRVNTWGYYIVAEVDGTEVALDRDNGSAQAGNVWILNVQFFVPRGSTYKIESYNQNDVEVTDSTTKAWAEYTFG